MSPLRTALIWILALGSTAVAAEQITCESRGDRPEACGTIVPGSEVRLVEQISNSPCIEGRTWGTGAENDSIWVSNGCRAVFEVQPRYTSSNDNYSDRYNENRADYDRAYERSDRERDRGTHYARAGGRSMANNACLNRVTTDQPYTADEVGTTEVRRVSDDLYVVNVNTPKGPMSCTVDRAGTVRSLEMDFR
jgi:hypothetical protein